MLDVTQYYTEFRWAGKDGFRCGFAPCKFDSFSRRKIEEHVMVHMTNDSARRAVTRDEAWKAKRRRTAPRTVDAPPAEAVEDAPEAETPADIAPPESVLE